MKPEIPLLAIGLAALVCAVVLQAIGVPVPVELWALAAATLGGGLGVTVPSSALQNDAADVETFVRSLFDEVEKRAGPPAPTPPTPTASSHPSSAPVATLSTVGTPS